MQCLGQSSDQSSFRVPEKNTAWQKISDTVDYRTLPLRYNETQIETVIYRFAPEQFIASIHHETQPKRFDVWQNELNVDVLINGAFFNEDYLPTGWLIIQGNEIGSNKYSSDNTGILFIENGVPRITQDALSLELVNEQISLVQSFPLLIKKGGVLGIAEDSEKIARRTVLAQDKNGLFLIILVDQSPVSLFELMHGLHQSDLELDIALNLDGGPSTGLIADLNTHQKSVIPLMPLPQVIGFSKRLQD